MSAPVVEPAVGNFAASGGVSTHAVTNTCEERIAIKVKISDPVNYKVAPVFQFIDPCTAATIVITRSNGPAKTSRLAIQYALAPAEMATPQEAFPAGAPAQELPVQLIAA